MPIIHQRVAGCSYIPDGRLVAFNIRNMPVVIQPKKITIYNTESELEAQGFIDWLNNIVHPQSTSHLTSPEKSEGADLGHVADFNEQSQENHSYYQS